jgi:hypothetical protein
MKFWQHYLRDHARYGTRVLHFIGNCFAVVALVLGVVMLDPAIPIVGVAMGVDGTSLGRAQPAEHGGASSVVLHLRCAHVSAVG